MSLTMPEYLAGYQLEDAVLTNTTINGMEFQVLLSRVGDWKQFAEEMGKKIQAPPWKSKEFPQYWYQIKDAEGQIQIQIGDGNPIGETIHQARWGNGNGTMTKVFAMFRLAGRPTTPRKVGEIALPNALAGCRLRAIQVDRLSSGPISGLLRMMNRPEGSKAVVSLVSMEETASFLRHLEESLKVNSRRSVDGASVCIPSPDKTGDLEIVVSPLKIASTNMLEFPPGGSVPKTSIEAHFRMK